jgi:hypothetical protein
MNSISWQKATLNYFIHTSGDVEILSAGCQKPKFNVKEKYGDSQSVVLWDKLNKENGVFTFYWAISSDTFPYYKKKQVDSVSYDLKQFCSDAEKAEQKKMWQELMEKNVEVKISPNPFTEEFECTVSVKSLEGMFKREAFYLGFYNDQGEQLNSRQIELDQPYIFAFPDIKAGKTIYYKVSWSDYKVGGQVLKN